MKRREKVILFFLLMCFFSVGAVYPVENQVDHGEGPAKSVTIVVEGIEGRPAENVSKMLEVPAKLIAEGVVDRPWLERYERQAPRKVRRALEPFGYYGPEVTTKVEPVGDGTYRVTVRVVPGKPVLVRDIRVEARGPGALEPSISELIAQFPLRRGSVMRHDLYDEAKGELQRRAVSLGYLDASFVEHSVKVSLENLSAQVSLILDTGIQYRFGEVSFSGTPLYPNSFLRRYLEFKPGEVYSEEKIASTHYNFVSADRFAIVTITGRKEEAVEGRVPMEISLVPSPPKRVRFGIGFGTDTGPRGLVRYQDFNFRQLGHVIDAEVKVSSPFQGLGIRYIVPSSLDIRSYTSVKVTGEREDTDNKTVRYGQLEGAYTRTISRGMLGTAFVRVQYEDSTAGTETTRAFMVLPGGRFAHQRYDNLIRPSKGFRYDVEIRGTDRIFGSNVSFLQLLASGELLTPLPGRFSVLTRLRAGATTDHEPSEDLPVSVRFFAGGDNSVRGYKYQSLGPKDQSGKVVGGRHLLTGTLELERAVARDWGIAAFYDVGNAFNLWSKMDLAQAVGLGVRYYTIVGPIRLDLARQIDVRKPDYRIHFTVGIGL